jgi:hypothetical protein
MRIKKHDGQWITELNQGLTNAVKIRRTDDLIILNQKSKLTGRNEYIRVRRIKLPMLIEMLQEFLEGETTTKRTKRL